MNRRTQSPLFTSQNRQAQQRSNGFVLENSTLSKTKPKKLLETLVVFAYLDLALAVSIPNPN